MDGIYLQKGSPFYWLRYYDKSVKNPNDRRKSVCTKIKATDADWKRWHEAKSKGMRADLKGTPELNRLVKEFKKGLAERDLQLKTGIKLIKEYTLTEAYDKFKSWSSIPGTKQFKVGKTLDNYTRVVDNLKEVAGDKFIGLYTKDDYYDLLRSYSSLSQNSMSIYTRSLKSLFNYFVKENWISSNVMESVDQEDKDPDPIAPDDMITIIQHLKKNTNSPHHYQIIYFMLLTGCRPSSAIVQLKEHINFKQRIITIQNIKTGKKKNKPFFKFPLYDELLCLLQEMNVQPGDSGRLFDMFAVTPANYTWPLQFWERAMDTLLDKPKKNEKDKDRKRKPQISRHYTLKQIRPTLATFLINVLKKDIFTVKRLLDHANIKITEKHYIYLDLDRIRKELQGVTLESFLEKNDDDAPEVEENT